MALLNAMTQGPDSIQQPTEQLQGQPPQPGGNGQQVITGMLAKLFPDENIQALADMLVQQRGNGMKPVVDAIVSTLIGFLKQGMEQGKALPVKVVMSSLIPILIKIAQSVEQDEQAASALLAEMISKIGDTLAQQGGQAGVLDQAQAQELQQLVRAFVERVSQHFNGGNQRQPQQPQPQQPMM